MEMAGAREGLVSGEMKNRGPRSHIRRRVAPDDNQERPYSREVENEERRSLRASYRELQYLIKSEKEEIGSADTRKFTEFVSKLDDYHESVRKPREQIVDAEAVLEVTRLFVDSVKDARRRTGTSPASFVEHIIRRFSLRPANRGRGRDANTPAVINWGRLGVAASGLFKAAAGLSTMLGPMDIEPKTRRAPAVRRPRNTQTQCERAEEVKDKSQDEINAQTDANMETMFKILKRVKAAPLDAMVLNRESFSQTVENIFSLSFLVKDGRASITFNEDGEHIVAPKNAPAAEARLSGEAKNTQFVFRLDYNCWERMKENVPESSELMPYRTWDLEPPSLVGNSRKRERDEA